MPKQISTSQLKYEAVNDLRAARHLLETEITAKELAKTFKWPMRRAKQCVANYRSEQTLLALQESAKSRENRPEIIEKARDWKHPASYYFDELQLILQPGVVNSFIVTEATPDADEEFFHNLSAFGNFRGASLIAGC